MKKVLLLLVLAQTFTVSAQDCPHCPPSPSWLSIFNPYNLPAVPEPEPLIEIRTPALTRNALASYCRRNTDVVDTIVFHHTQTPSTSTVQNINDMHLDRGSAADPWLMIGYHYTINSPYAGGTIPAPVVNQGRPFDLAGSHAGTNSYRSADEETKDLMALDGAIRCGTVSGPLTEATDKFNPSGLVKANYNTVAIALIGNYAKRSSENPGGWRAPNRRFPSTATIEMAGKLACELQRKHPRLKTIRVHRYYNSTDCPGLVEDRIPQIKAVAARFGCTFN